MSLTHTPAVLDILREHDAHATSFVVGASADLYPELIVRMIAEGHEIAFHKVALCTRCMERSQFANAEKA